MEEGTFLTFPRKGIFHVRNIETERMLDVVRTMCRGVFLHPHELDAAFLHDRLTANNARPPAPLEALQAALRELEKPQTKGGMGSWGKGEKIFNARLQSGRPADNAFVIRQLFNINDRRAVSGFVLYQDALRCLASEYAFVAEIPYREAEHGIKERLVAAHMQTV